MDTKDGNRLYLLESHSRKYPWINQSYCSVKFSWFTYKRNDPPLPYSDVIQNYSSLDEELGYLEELVDECFALHEAEAIKSFLDEATSFKTKIIPVDIPIHLPTKHKLFKLRAVGRGRGFYLLDKLSQYPFTYSVAGYYDASSFINHQFPLRWIPFA